MKLLVDQEITLKLISRQFAEELFALVSSNFENKLCYWCPDLKTTYMTLDSTKAHIDDAISKFEEDKTPDFLIFHGHSLVGLISLSPVDKARNTSEVGYWLGGEHEGKGIISRAFPFVLNYAKNVLQLKALELSTAVPNAGSQKLPLKFKFHKIKIIHNAEMLKDGLVDHTLWRYDF